MARMLAAVSERTVWSPRAGLFIAPVWRDTGVIVTYPAWLNRVVAGAFARQGLYAAVERHVVTEDFVEIVAVVE